MIEVSDVVFSYGGTPALRGISLQVPEGQVTALVGPSGSGKSTLLGVIARELRETQGCVSIDGLQMNGHERHSEVARIYQDYRLVPFINALANISLAVELKETLSYKECGERAASALEAVGLTPKAKSLPLDLSGGEQQRLAIARAVATRPRYLLADEPTGSLDAENSVKIAKLLSDIARSHGVGVLVATHDPLVSDVAEQVVTIRDGRVV